jgi:spore photoproduct lyase
MWKPKEIIVHETVKDDSITKYFQGQCPGVPVGYVTSGKGKDIVRASDILSNCGTSMLDKILAGKQMVYIAPANKVVDSFNIPDDRMICPHFNRLKLASNGCFYQCDWCYLKSTYRAAFPFITVRVQYDKIKKQITKRLRSAQGSFIFNSGELADSLSMEHLTKAGREFIPWFGKTQNGYLFMLTKSDNVDHILNLPHNGHTIVAWSLNNEMVSRKFEVGAPPFERRLKAAHKIQEAGYRLRIRLDPVVPLDGWRSAYSETIERIFNKVSPERITIGTLRFQKEFYNIRNSIFTTGPELPALLENMQPMFPPKVFPGLKRPTIGKYSFSDEKRAEIFSFISNEIRKYSDRKIALCKESPSLWQTLGLDLSRCSCVCQLDYVDMDK